MNHWFKIPVFTLLMLCIVAIHGSHAEKTKVIRGKALDTITWNKVKTSKTKIKIGTAVIKGKSTDIYCDKALSCGYTTFRWKSSFIIYSNFLVK